MARGREHYSELFEFILAAIFIGGAILFYIGLILPGNALFCVGRRDNNFPQWRAGLIMFCVGLGLALGPYVISLLTFLCKCYDSSALEQILFQKKVYIPLIVVLILGLSPAIGCGVGFEVSN